MIDVESFLLNTFVNVGEMLVKYKNEISGNYFNAVKQTKILSQVSNQLLKLYSIFQLNNSINIRS